MSAEIPPHNRELRVAIVVPGENALIAPLADHPTLFISPSNQNEQVTSAETRAKQLISSSLYDLPPMSAHRQLLGTRGITGYALRPASGTAEINLRAFAVRKFSMDEVFEVIRRNPKYVDPIDLHFIEQAFRKVRP